MCGLFLGGAAHADDDVRAIASSATAAEQQVKSCIILQPKVKQCKNKSCQNLTIQQL